MGNDGARKVPGTLFPQISHSQGDVASLTNYHPAALSLSFCPIRNVFQAVRRVIVKKDGSGLREMVLWQKLLLLFQRTRG